MPTIDDPTRVFEQERARLIRLAYRMLGSLGEAEDVVQDAWLRWRHVDHPGVASAGAFLFLQVYRYNLQQIITIYAATVPIIMLFHRHLNRGEDYATKTCWCSRPRSRYDCSNRRRR
ncbi:hypothetical protein FV226_12175 [Methylobacterium sp. WL12]|nr:hypothetical protein FV226_12175 [Methylobacterium sp. WL12]